MQTKTTSDSINSKIDEILRKTKDIALLNNSSVFDNIKQNHQVLQKIQDELSLLEPTDLEQSSLKVKFKICQEKVQHFNNQLIKFNEEAEKIALRFSEEHNQAIEELISFHGNDPDSRYKRLADPKGTGILFNKPDSNFQSRASIQRKTWIALRPKLENYSQTINYKATKHNNLSLLLLPDDASFLDAVDFGHLPLEGEIGYLAFQRLKDIAITNKEHRRQANQLISSAFPDIKGEGLVCCNESALHNEFYKLAMYALLNPSKKVAWLGTARTVEAVRDKLPGEGIYLNPLPEEITWELNRAWLQAAARLGYEFKLVEQHFPNVEKAILSGDPCRLITELTNEIRSEKKVSQYNGSFSPTATTQEILALLDMGCVAKKNADNSLSLHPSASKESPTLRIEKNAQMLGLKRNHSTSDFFRAAPLPPLPRRKEHFIAPELCKTLTLTL
ncbi:MAG: hypothetical protein H0U73_11175 [Tatlockia sp.]|nr:hypothetical protein [Tatlockia sp.]